MLLDLNRHKEQTHTRNSKNFKPFSAYCIIHKYLKVTNEIHCYISREGQKPFLNKNVTTSCHRN